MATDISEPELGRTTWEIEMTLSSSLEQVYT